MWTFATSLLILQICYSAPDWDHTLPSIRALVESPAAQISLQQSTGENWAIIEYQFGPDKDAGNKKYKTNLIFHYNHQIMEEHNVVGTFWSVYIFPLDIGNGVNVLQSSIDIVNHGGQVDFDTMIPLETRENKVTMDVSITSTAVIKGTSAKIDNVEATQTVDIYQRKHGDWLPIHEKTGRWAMNAIMQLLVNQLGIETITLGDGSSRPCPNGTPLDAIPYGVYNAYKGYGGYYIQWFFKSPKKSKRTAERNAIHYLRNTPVRDIWGTCNKKQKSKMIKNKQFPFPKKTIKKRGIKRRKSYTFEEYIQHTLHLDANAPIGDFMNSIYGIDCRLYSKWYLFWRQRGQCDQESMDVYNALLGGEKKYKPTGTEHLRIVSSHMDKINYLDDDMEHMNDNVAYGSDISDVYNLYRRELYAAVFGAMSGMIVGGLLGSYCGVKLT